MASSAWALTTCSGCYNLASPTLDWSSQADVQEAVYKYLLLEYGFSSRRWATVLESQNAQDFSVCIKVISHTKLIAHSPILALWTIVYQGAAKLNHHFPLPLQLWLLNNYFMMNVVSLLSSALALSMALAGCRTSKGCDSSFYFQANMKFCSARCEI